jgi:hypothetical protein
MFPKSLVPEENPITLLIRHWDSQHRGGPRYKIVDSPLELPGDKKRWIWKSKLDVAQAIIPSLEDPTARSRKHEHIKVHLATLLNAGTPLQ